MSNAEYIDIDSCDSLLEHPEYSDLNRDLGLPPQSIALADAIREFGRDELKAKIESIKRDAPFVFYENYFISNIVYFIRNLEKTKGLWPKIQTATNKVSNSSREGAWMVTHALSGIARREKLVDDSEFFLIAESFLDSINSTDIKDLASFHVITELVTTCRSREEFWKIISALYTNNFDISQLESISGIGKLQIFTLALKITDGCTRQCSFCYENAEPKLSKAKNLTIADLDEMREVLKMVGSVNLNGGEPLEHPNIIGICQYLSEIGVPFSITTTGGNIETLEQLLPFFKNGSAVSFTLSVHGFYNARVKKLSSQTAAFFVRHNIPFIINTPVPDISDLQAAQHVCQNIARLLGCMHYNHGFANGRQVQNFYSTGSIPRDPLVMLRIVAAFPEGKHINDNDAYMNAHRIGSALTQVPEGLSSFCNFGNPTISSNKKVYPCCTALAGRDSGVPFMMDHLPTSIDELLEAMEEYRREVLDTVLTKSNEQGVLPCFVCRDFQKEG